MDKYSIIRTVGKGSFGKVYLVKHKRERALYVMKVIKMKGIPKKEREACRNEVQLMQRLAHPNIVAFKESFFAKHGEQLCIVMTNCDGGDLQNRVNNARRKLFSEDQIMHWFVQICLGLHFMHTNKVLHRDIKTQNIFLLGNGRLVLGDLGISKVLDGTMAFASTQIGTPYYMSPELFKNKPYNHKSDVWATGCVLYELTTLKHAFDAQSLNGLASKIMRGTYSPISPRYSKHLKALIGAMLAVRPADRPGLEDILRMSFIKKHIYNFIHDIAQRSSGIIGEGTSVFKAGVMAAAGMASIDDIAPHSDNLRAQMEGLGLMSVLQAALKRDDPRSGLVGPASGAGAGKAAGPPVSYGVGASAASGASDAARRGAAAAAAAAAAVSRPVAPAADARRVRRVVSEQEKALQREEERKRAVEMALKRLRDEKEERRKQREDLRAKQQRAYEARLRHARGVPAASRAAAARGAAIRQQQAERERRRKEAASRRSEMERRRVADLNRWERERKLRADNAARAREEEQRQRRAKADAEAAARRREAAELERQREAEAAAEQEKRDRERKRIEDLQRAERQRIMAGRRAKEEEERQRRVAESRAEAEREREREREAERERLAKYRASGSDDDGGSGPAPLRRGSSYAGNPMPSGTHGHSGPRVRDPFKNAASASASSGGDAGSSSGGRSRRDTSPIVVPQSRSVSESGAPATARDGYSVADSRVPGRPPVMRRGVSAGPTMAADARGGGADDPSMEGLSARERVLARKQAKRRAEEEEQKRALAAAARENVGERRRLKEAAVDQYRPSGGNLMVKDTAGGVRTGGSRPGSGYSARDKDGGGSSGGEGGDYFSREEARMNAEEERQAQLGAAAEAVMAVDLALPGARYDDVAPAARDSAGYSLGGGDERDDEFDSGSGEGGSGSGSAAAGRGEDDVDLMDDLDDDEEDDEDAISGAEDVDLLESSEDELLAEAAPDDDDSDDDAEEQQLQAELHRTALRCDDLRTTLEQARAAVASGAVPAGDAVEEASDETEEEDDDEFFPVSVHPEPVGSLAPSSHGSDSGRDRDKDDFFGGGGGGGGGGGSGAGGAAGRTPGKGPRDLMSEIEAPPTPSGRLEERMRHLRQRCVNDLGEALFDRVYTFLREKLWEPESEHQGEPALEMGGESFDDNAVVSKGLIEMLGEHRVREYRELVEQLLLMENSAFGL